MTMAHDRFDSAAMIKDPLKWPYWPYLPMRKKTGDRSIESGGLGLLYADDDMVIHRKPTIYHVNIYDLPPTLAELLASPKTEYNSIEEMLADDWEVD